MRTFQPGEIGWIGNAGQIESGTFIPYHQDDFIGGEARFHMDATIHVGSLLPTGACQIEINAETLLTKRGGDFKVSVVVGIF